MSAAPDAPVVAGAGAGADTEPEVPAWRRLTAGLRTLPDWLVLGAQKAGTTSLHRYLEAHPAVLRCAAKEIHYFDLRFERGLDWYRAHFPTAALRRVVRGVRSVALAGESSPYYLFHPLAPRRAAATVPDARLIVLLRDPAERAFSHYRHVRRLGLEECATFAEAIEREEARLAGERERMIADPSYVSFSHRHHAYVARGRYAEQLRAWWQHFPRERVLVLSSHRLRAAPQETLHEAQDFLGLPRFAPPRFELHNRGDDATLDPGLRAEIDARLLPDARELRALLGDAFAFGAAR